MRRDEQRNRNNEDNRETVDTNHNFYQGNRTLFDTISNIGNHLHINTNINTTTHSPIHNSSTFPLEHSRSSNQVKSKHLKSNQNNNNNYNSSIDKTQSHNAGVFEIKVITLSKSETFEVSPLITIAQLKQQVIDRLSVPPSKTIRLIFRGRLLEESMTLETANIAPNSTIHCSISDSVTINTNSSSPNESEDDAPLRGFNRLRHYGFTANEITQIRVQFHTNRLANNGFLARNTSPEELMRLEEEWINSEGLANSNSANNRQSSAQNNNNDGGNSTTTTTTEEEYTGSLGTTEDMFKGLVMGFLLGLIVVLWLPDRSLPLRTKIGIVGGICISFAFGLLRGTIQ